MSPDDRKYTQEHEWVMVENAERGQALVGITDYAQDQLGDVVYLDLPRAGSSVRQQDKMGEVESVKAVSDIFSPVSGQVMEVNTISHSVSGRAGGPGNQRELLSHS